MKLKRILFCVISAAFAVTAMFSFVGNMAKVKQEVKNQLVLTQGNDLTSNSNLLADHCSHRSHSSHSSHSSHYSCC